MAIWIRNEQGDFVTAHTVKHQGEIFILSKQEYDALAEAGADVAAGADGQKVVRDFLRDLGGPITDEKKMKRYLFEIYTKSGASQCGFVDAIDEKVARFRLTQKFGEHQEVVLDPSKEDRPDWGMDAIHY